MIKKTILDRKTAKEEIRRDFNKYSVLITDIIDYGTNIVLRFFSICERDTVLFVVIGALFKQYLTLLDSIELLFSNGAILATNTPARSLWEISLFIKWILQDSQEKRARQYYVWFLRYSRYNYNRSIINTKEYDNLTKKINQSSNEMLKHEISPHQNAKEIVNKINKILLNKKNREINDVFDQLKEKKKNMQKAFYDVDWFVPNGPCSINDMANKLGIGIEFIVEYNKLSGNTHGTNMSEHIEFSKNKFILKPIRSLDSMEFILKVVISNSINTYRNVIKYFRPEEIENFEKKYQEEWSELVKSLNDIKLKQVIHSHSLDI